MAHEEDYMQETYNANTGYPGGLRMDDDDDDETTDTTTDEEETPKKKATTPQQIFLIVGHSGGGKTTLSQDLIRSILGERKKQRVLLVNDNTGKAPPRGWKKVDWAALEDARDSAVVFEDVISTSKKHFEILKSVIHHHNHHKNLNPVLILSHVLTKNGIFALLPGFRRIYVAAAASSLNSYRTLLRYFGYEKHQIQALVNSLKAVKDKYNFAVIDVEGGSKIRITRAGDRTETDRQNTAQAATTAGVERQTLEKFMHLLPNSERAMATAELVLAKIDPSQVDPTTLSISLYERGRRVHISLLDFVEAIGREEENADPPDGLHLKFFRHLLARQCRLPLFFVKNPHFRTAAAAAAATKTTT